MAVLMLQDRFDLPFIKLLEHILRQDGTSFTVMKQRIRAIARYREYPKRQIRMLYTCSVVVMLVLFVVSDFRSVIP